MVFQSTPDIAAGRSRWPLWKKSGGWHVSIHARHRCRAIPEERPWDALTDKVSLHARHRCRAIHRLQRKPSVVFRFQSTPDIAAGRSHLCGQVFLVCRSVSIHARHRCRAIQDVGAHAAVPFMFQSTPDIAAGRSGPVAPIWCALQRFQSTPDIAAGRSASAHAAPASIQKCFNPRPTSLPGDPLLGRVVMMTMPMFQSTPDIAAGRSNARIHWSKLSKAFQSTPDIAAGRSLLQSMSTDAGYLFQSTPDIAAGRSPHQTQQRQRDRCFNPRPTSLPGDPEHAQQVGTAQAVSIHARHRCRAIPFSRKLLIHFHFSVQSREHLPLKALSHREVATESGKN